MKLKDKVALVTGSSSGIGARVAELFAREGARVAVVASSDLAKAATVADRIVADGGVAKPFTANVGDVAAVNKLVGDVASELGPIDILVNSAGLYYPTPMGETSESDYDAMADTNLKGTYFAINAVVPAMKERKTGKIINLSSVAAYQGIPTYGLYCAVKSAIMMLTRSLATELAPFDINVNAIAPGNTATPMNEALRLEPEHAEYRAAMEQATPSNRTFTPPEEIANLALFLASDDARAMHGSTILIDEGISAGF